MSVLEDRRRLALETLKQRPHPGRKDENWRFINLSELTGGTFKWAAGDVPVPHNWDAQLLHSGLGDRLVMVNGLFSPELSFLSQGVTVSTELNGSEIGSLLEDPDNTFALENTARFEYGIHILAESGSPEVHLVWLNVPGSEPTVAYPRMFASVTGGAQLKLFEEFLTLGDGSGFTNAAAEIQVGDGSVCAHTRLVHESDHAWHMGATAFRVGRDARYQGFSVVFGGKLCRVDIHGDLAAPGAECSLDGLYGVTGKQVTDHHTYIRHREAHTTSSQTFKGVLSGSGRGVFNGRITIDPDGQGSRAEQTNQNLLLSDAALVHTNPQLLIFADDVQCRHGATVGQLDEDQLFYLRSRGLGQEESRRMLTRAFVSGLLERLPQGDAAEEIAGRVMERIYGDV